MGAARKPNTNQKRGLKMKTTITAIALATAFAVPMAAVTATPAASWGVVTKWWESNKDKKFWKGVRSSDCWKEGASMSLYDSGNKIC